MISWLAVFRDSTVPPRVVPGDPGLRVVPARVMAFGAAVMGWTAMMVVIVFGTVDAVKGIVLEPTTNWPASSRDSTVPSIVVPGAPGLREVPAMATAVGAAVIAWPAIVVMSCVGAGDTKDTVLEPTTRADGSKCIGVPDTVMGGAPGVKVVPATAMAFEAAVMTCPAMLVVIGIGALGVKGNVDVPMTKADEPR